MYNKNYSTNFEQSQDEFRILQKAAIKRNSNKYIIEWLKSEKEYKKAENIQGCGTFIGITTIEGVTKIVKSNFCRERLCQICAWRRQSKFVAQIFPIINNLKNLGYEFIEVVLTVKNPCEEELNAEFDKMMKAFQLLTKTRAIKRAWKGFTRSIEITYNDKENTFHPHIHMLVVVEKDYFQSDKYITQEKLIQLWKEKLCVEYGPSVYIKKITNDEVGAVENIKYSLKPTLATNALRIFNGILKGRRLISFNGIIADMRKELKYSSIDDIQSDDIEHNNYKNISYNLYKFDATGGVYSFYNKYELF